MIIVSADIRQQYIGCYKDNSNRVMTGAWIENASMTVEWCQLSCQESTYTYFGLQVQLYITKIKKLIHPNSQMRIDLK